jgi:hypothetical protein
MMLDQGFGKGDMSLRLHQLKFYLRAVINAILDYKMHCENLSDDEAASCSLRWSFKPRAKRLRQDRAARSKVHVSYRRTSSAAWRSIDCGSRFPASKATHSIWRYHERVLAWTLPVKFLPGTGA